MLETKLTAFLCLIQKVRKQHTAYTPSQPQYLLFIFRIACFVYLMFLIIDIVKYKYYFWNFICLLLNLGSPGNIISWPWIWKHFPFLDSYGICVRDVWISSLKEKQGSKRLVQYLWLLQKCLNMPVVQDGISPSWHLVVLKKKKGIKNMCCSVRWWRNL